VHGRTFVKKASILAEAFLPDPILVGRKTSQNFEVVESNKRSGGTLWVSGNYGYVKKWANKDGRIYLACQLNKMMGCKGRAYIDTGVCAETDRRSQLRVVH
jgi:hypothetical protein